MKMKILKILFFACLIVPVMTQAQRFDRDEIESLRVALFTKQMELTPAESKVFWPIYNKFREAMNKQHRRRRERMRNMRKDMATLSAAEGTKTGRDERRERACQTEYN